MPREPGTLGGDGCFDLHSRPCPPAINGHTDPSTGQDLPARQAMELAEVAERQKELTPGKSFTPPDPSESPAPRCPTAASGGSLHLGPDLPAGPYQPPASCTPWNCRNLTTRTRLRFLVLGAVPGGGLPCRLVRALWRPAVAAVGPRADRELAPAGRGGPGDAGLTQAYLVAALTALRSSAAEGSSSWVLLTVGDPSCPMVPVRHGPSTDRGSGPVCRRCLRRSGPS